MEYSTHVIVFHSVFLQWVTGDRMIEIIITQTSVFSL